MNKTNIQALVDAALQEMQGMGGTAAQQKALRFGCGKILRYFKQQGKTEYEPEEANSFVYSLREIYERGEMSHWAWGTVRRAAALLDSFHKTGKMDLAPLPQWEVLHNPIHLPPTQQQLEEEGNVHALIWQTQQELLKFNLLSKSMSNYRYDGFGRILRLHMRRGVTQYSKILADESVNEAREQFQQGRMCRSVYCNIRKAAALLDEYHRTGTLEWRVLKRWGLREPNEEFAQALVRFCSESLHTGRYSAGTVRNAKSAIRGFLFVLEDAGIHSFDNMTPKVVNDGITVSSKRYHGNKHVMPFSVRIFLLFLYENGITQKNLSTAIPELVAPRRTVREGFSIEEIQGLLNAPDKDTSLGKRDYAMMLLAAQTGLRSVDIACLKRGDICWRSNEIRIVQQKTGKAVSLPLEPESGNAIAEYLLHYRPDSDLPFVFLSACRPFRPLDSRSVSANVSKYMRRAGVDTASIPRRGSHSFRRAFGTRLLESEIPLDTLRQLLGTSQMNSVRPYLSVSEQGLKSCALGLVSAERAGDQ